MIKRLIQDIRKALENELYFVALNSALTLPDICGNVEYPKEKSSRKRYISWYDKEIGKYEKDPNEKDDMSYLSGEVIYTLRCSLLHEGNPNVQNDKLREAKPIDDFSLIIQKSNQFDIYFDGSISSIIINSEDRQIRKYEMNVRRICMILCGAAESYYEENIERFHFNYKIIDWDRAVSQLSPIDTDSILAGLVKNSEEISVKKEKSKNE